VCGHLFIFVSLIFSNSNIRHLLDSLVSALAVYATAFGSKRSLAPKKTDMKSEHELQHELVLSNPHSPSLMFFPHPSLLQQPTQWLRLNFIPASLSFWSLFRALEKRLKFVL